MRLLQCLDCLSVETLPNFVGPKSDEGHDPLLQRLVDRHQGPLNREQLHRRPSNAPRVREIRMDEPHFGNLHTIDDALWNHPDPSKRDEIRRSVLKEMWKGHTGYPEEFYATKDTFMEDAGICYQRHGRPGGIDSGPDGCIDYMSESKRLTDTDWEARGERMGSPRSHVYLCQFCPYQSVVTTRKRSARGDYDN